MPLPLVISFVGVIVGFFAPFDCLGEPHPDGEHASQREGKYVMVSLRCASWGILDFGRAKCGLLCDAGRDGLGTSFWKLHPRRVLLSGRGDVRSETGAWEHLCCLNDNQPYLSLAGSSDQGCAEIATNYLVPQGHHCSPTQRPPLYSGLQPLPTGYGPQRCLPRRRSNCSPVRAGVAHISSGTGFGERCRID